MKKLFALLGGCLLSATAVAQEKLPVPPMTQSTTPHVVQSCEPTVLIYEEQADCGRDGGFYGSVDALLWWLRPNKVYAPLINGQLTPSDLSIALETGGLDDPNTFVLFGNQNLNPGEQLGIRTTLGRQLSECTAVEATGFWIPRQTEAFRINSPAGSPAFVLTFREAFLDPNGIETGGVFAGPFSIVPDGFLAGNLNITSQTELWGAEINGVRNVRSNDRIRVDAIGGARYLGMHDELSIHAAVINGTGGSIFDEFETRNYFYGGQVGARVTWTGCRVTATASAKIAAGVTTARLNISGDHILPVGTPDDGTTGGFYALSTNSGKTTHNRFAFVPEVALNLAYKVRESIAVNLGYTGMYWSDVMRSGGQIDRNVNFLVNPVFGAGADRTVGPRVPRRLNDFSDFWAQGFNLGLTFSY